jgi:hypothetical protein
VCGVGKLAMLAILVRVAERVLLAIYMIIHDLAEDCQLQTLKVAKVASPTLGQGWQSSDRLGESTV